MNPLETRERKNSSHKRTKCVLRRHHSSACVVSAFKFTQHLTYPISSNLLSLLGRLARRTNVWWGPDKVDHQWMECWLLYTRPR